MKEQKANTEDQKHCTKNEQSFDELSGRLHKADEGISELDDRYITRSFKNWKAKKKKKERKKRQNRKPKDCEKTEKVAKYI